MNNSKNKLKLQISRNFELKQTLNCCLVLRSEQSPFDSPKILRLTLSISQTGTNLQSYNTSQ